MIRPLQRTGALLAGLALGTALCAEASAFGWQEHPGTVLFDQCPADNFGGSGYDFTAFCKGVTNSWNGGAYDPVGDRLYIWGGGHNDYYGNEIYAFDLNAQTLLRLTDPSLPIADANANPGQSQLAPFDGTAPNSRHTYGGLAFMPHVGKMWAFSGALAGRFAGADSLTWLFDPQTASWALDNALGDIPAGAYAVVSAFDPNTNQVFLHNRKGLYTYTYAESGGTYTALNDDGNIGLYGTAVIDPVRKLLFIFGKDIEAVYQIGDGSTFERQSLQTTGDRGLLDFPSPGLAFDPVAQEIVGWAGDGKIYRFDPDSGNWTSTAFANGPGPQSGHGTFGRFSYSPGQDRFVLYNNYNQNAYSFAPPRDVVDTTAPEAPDSVVLEAPLPSVVKISWAPAIDDFGVAGYRIFRDGVLVTDTAQTSYGELSLQADTEYHYQVAAYDSAGHLSALSSIATIRTPALQVSLPLGNCASEPGLDGRSDVLFCEPWEDPAWWQNGYLRDPVVDDPRPALEENVNRTQVISDGCFSGNCLRVDMLKGETKGLSLHWPLAEAEQAPEKLYLRYYLKLAPDWTPDMCTAEGEYAGAGGKFPGLADPRTWKDEGGQCGNGGASSDGKRCWSMRSNYRTCSGAAACGGKPDGIARFGSYLYHYDQHGSTGDSGYWDGDSRGPAGSGQGTCESNPRNMFCGSGDGGVLVPDRWHRMEMQVTLNTPGAADGIIRGWVDGVLSFEKTNTIFRITGHDMLHNRVVWLNVFKGGTLGNCVDSAIFLDQMVVTTDAPPGGVDSDTLQPPTLTLSAAPPQTAIGESVSLQWDAQDADQCVASGDWSGSRAVQGLEVIAPANDPSVFALECSGAGGTARRQVSVAVAGGVPVVDDADGAVISVINDITEPDTPAMPEPTLIGADQIGIQWAPAQDNVGVQGYRVLRNDQAVATVSETSFLSTALAPGTTYRFNVEAFDASGNVSALSPTLEVQTAGEPGINAGGILTLYPDSDTYTDPSTVNASGSKTNMDSDNDSNMLLRFALEAIAAGADIRSAELRLFTQAQYGDMQIGAFRADKNWHEAVTTRTYYDRDAQLRWDNELGDWIDLDGIAQGSRHFASTTIIDDNTPKFVTIDVTALLQGWLAGDFANLGLLLKNVTGSGANTFSSKEHPSFEQRPSLVIEFEPEAAPPVEITARADSYLTGSSTSSKGHLSYLDLATSRNVIVHFDTDTLDPNATVTHAVLRMYNFAQYSNISSAGVFAAAKPWTESKATRSNYDTELAWDNWLGDWRAADGQAQGDLAYDSQDLVDDNTGKWIEWDVTDLVKAWAEGTLTNNGLMVRSMGGGTHRFHSSEAADATLHPRLVVMQQVIAPQETVAEPSPGPVTLDAQADTYLSGSSVSPKGNSAYLDLTPTRNVLLQFDTSEVPVGPVSRAVVRIYSFAQYGALPRAGSFAVAQPWVESKASSLSATQDQPWVNWLGDWHDKFGAAQGTDAWSEVALDDDNTGKWIEWDITTLVQAWLADPSSNNGVMLRAMQNGGTHRFYSRQHTDSALHPQLIIERD